MRRGLQDQSPAPNKREERDLFHLLLPSAHTHIPKGKAAMWDRHYQTQHAAAPRPTRPPLSSHLSPTSSLARTPRVVLASPAKNAAQSRCKSADPTSSPRHVKIGESRSPLCTRTATDPRLESDRLEPASDRLHLNADAREHVEMKACMLAHMHRIDVDELDQLRETAWRELDDIKTQQLLVGGGVLDDGSLMGTTKRKTSFLLRHFLTLVEQSPKAGSTKQDSLLYDVIDEWSCRDNASAEEIADLWKSVNAHIENSYVLRHQLVPKSDPNPLSITIAMDCLRRLPAKLPDYRRMLDVIIVLIESGLYLPTTSTPDRGGSSKIERKKYYFDEYLTTHDALERELGEKRLRLAAEAQHDAATVQTPRQQLEAILASLKSGDKSSDEIDVLFRLIFHSEVRRLIPVALHEVLPVCFDGEDSNAGFRKLFFDTWMPLLLPDDATDVLVELTKHHIGAFQTFFHNEIDAMDKLLMEPIVSSTPFTSATKNSRRSSRATPAATSPRRSSRVAQQTATPSESPATSLFHELIERHPSQFAAVLWASPFLTAHVFQDSQHLIARILEQNIVLVSQVLQQRPDVLTTLLNYTLKDNSIAVEEFLQSHPKAFSDLLLNKGPSVATAIKSYPAILVDILQASRSTLAKVLLSMPELLCSLFKSMPELLAQTLREDVTILPLAFSVVPQCLSDALERHPEYFVDVAHRKPALVAKVFAKYPDLLLDPLEANPSVFTNFLVYHRKILPDFSSPSFDPSFFQFERKQYADMGQQTEKRLCKYDGKLRMRERMKLQEDSQAYAIRQALANNTLAINTNGRTTPAVNGNAPIVQGAQSDRSSVKDSQPTNAALISPSQVVGEIARIYMKKLDIDAKTDAVGNKRQVLVDFVLDLYIQELGFKSKAQKKLTLLLAGAKQAEQESLRIKWFLRFMNAGSIASYDSALSPAQSSDVLWTYHPLASDFYRLAAQFLVSLPNDEFSKHLEEELVRPCLVGYTRVKQFIEDPLMVRMLPAKDQRQQLLAGICEKEQLIHGVSTDNPPATRASSTTNVLTLHLEDVLESFMLVRIQYQDRIRSEWATQFQLVNPDGSGVLRYNAFADLIRAKVPNLDDSAIMKIYHQCGEDNDLGEYFIAVDDFSLAMSIVQEQDSIREYAARNNSNAANSS